MTLFPKRLALAATLALLAAPAAASAQTTILPGYWVSTDRLEFLLSKDTTTRKCLTPDEVEQWMTSPSNRHYHCTYDRRHVADGRAHFEGECMDRKGRKLNVVLDGDYTPTHFHLVAHFTARLVGVPLGGTAVTDARRISADCPADLTPGK